MAYEIIRPNFQLPVRPASSIVPRAPVKLVGSAVLAILPVGSSNDRPFGYIGEATAAQAYGDSRDSVSQLPGVVLEEGNIVKAICGASVGAGAEVTVATVGVATITQGGSSVATVPQLGPLAVASGVAQWSHGWALEPGVPGALFTIYVKPRLTGSFYN